MFHILTEGDGSAGGGKADAAARRGRTGDFRWFQGGEGDGSYFIRVAGHLASGGKRVGDSLQQAGAWREQVGCPVLAEGCREGGGGSAGEREAGQVVIGMIKRVSDLLAGLDIFLAVAQANSADTRRLFGRVAEYLLMDDAFRRIPNSKNYGIGGAGGQWLIGRERGLAVIVLAEVGLGKGKAARDIRRNA